MRRFLQFVVLSGVIAVGTPAWADTSLWVVSGEAEAQITTALNTVTITLTDLYVDPNSVSDNLSAFKFTLSNAPTSASITSSSGDKVTVSGPGYTVGGAEATGWTLSLLSATTTLDDLVGAGHAGPSNTIIGAPGSEGYGDANGSLTGKSHNPFLYETATFTLDEAGVTAATTVTAATFQFGTTDGQNQVAGVDPPLPPSVPEPSTFLLSGCAGLLLLLRKTRRAI